MIRSGIYSILLLVMGILIVSCKSEHQKAADRILELEKIVFDTIGRVQPDKIDTLLKAYLKFAEQFPGNPQSPEFLLKAGTLAMNTNKPLQAIQYFQKILQDYPDFQKAPEALFLQGFTYENYLGNLDKAKEIYEKFIELYPEDDFADDARISLKYLGIPPDKLLDILHSKSIVTEPEASYKGSDYKGSDSKGSEYKGSDYKESDLTKKTTIEKSKKFK